MSTLHPDQDQATLRPTTVDDLAREVVMLRQMRNDAHAEIKLAEQFANVQAAAIGELVRERDTLREQRNAAKALAGDVFGTLGRMVRERDRLLAVLRLIRAQSIGPDWTYQQAFEFIRATAKRALDTPQAAGVECVDVDDVESKSV